MNGTTSTITNTVSNVTAPATYAPSEYALAILNGLQGMKVYGGTVPAKVTAKRRAANKVARASRRANRGR